MQNVQPALTDYLHFEHFSGGHISKVLLNLLYVLMMGKF